MSTLLRPLAVALLIACLPSVVLAEGTLVTGTVTHSVTGEPINGFAYELYDLGEGLRTRSGGASGGDFEIHDVPPGTYTVAVTWPSIVDQLLGGIECESTDIDRCANFALGDSFEVTATTSVVELEFTVDRRGIITGTVTGGDGFMLAEAYTAADFTLVANHPFVGDGEYILEGLAPGEYFVRVTGDTIVDQLYDGIACVQELTLEGCDNLADATPVATGRNLVTDGIDFTLQLGGTMSGRVVDLATGEPVDRARVSVWDSAGRRRRGDDSDSDGHFRVTGLNTGTYTATAVSPFPFRFNPQLYLGLDCPEAGSDLQQCDVTAGTPISVTAALETPGIDFPLRPRAAVGGLVTHAVTGERIYQATVGIYDTAGTRVAFDQPDSNGFYQAGGLDAGTYFARITVSRPIGVIDEIYDGVPCPWYGDPCEPHRAGAPIIVNADTLTDGIDFTLEPGGTFSGRVTDAATSEPLAGFSVTVWSLSGRELNTTQTDSEGRYSAPDLTGPALATGSYYATINSGTYLGEVWGGPYCQRAGDERCNITAGAPIPVERGRDTPGINFELDIGGSIEGRVTHALTGEPLTARVRAWDQLGVIDDDVTDPQGFYSIEGLPPGSFLVSTLSLPHLDQLYAGIPCPGDACDPPAGVPEGGLPVPVNLATATDGIDFSLNTLGEVRGRITAPGLDDLTEEFEIELWNDGGRVKGTLTAADGTYAVPYVAPDTYYATVESLYDTDWISELYDDQLCPLGFRRCDLTVGAPIEVESDSFVEGIDFDLELGGTVSGRIVDAATGEPIPEAFSWADLYTYEGGFLGRGFANSSGAYTLRGFSNGISPGTYFAVGNSVDHVHQVYSGIDCPRFEVLSCALDQATPVTVTNATDQPGIDFALNLGGSIAGHLTSAATGEPIMDVDVWARDATGRRVDGFLNSEQDGSYRIRGLPTGSYYLTTEHPDFEDTLYPGLPCPDGACDVTAGVAVSVVAGEQSGGFDFEIGSVSPCEPGVELCLQDDTFKVRATWRDFDGNTGSGNARLLSSGSGVFWFFSPDNIELMIKVLDGCDSTFNSYWVFAAGLTNVAVDLEVTHVASGVTWSSANPLGTAFAPILDVEALPVCDAARQATAATATVQDSPPLVPPAVPAKIGECVPDATSLCLTGGRFRVEALWRTTGGETGRGQTLPLTDETGTFWFFSLDNLEVIVKVLDACDGSFGPEGFWVFAAGLTDVEVTLRVTDLVSGESRDYVNSQGRAFQPIQDTSTFSACP